MYIYKLLKKEKHNGTSLSHFNYIDININEIIIEINKDQLLNIIMYSIQFKNLISNKYI